MIHGAYAGPVSSLCGGSALQALADSRHKQPQQASSHRQQRAGHVGPAMVWWMLSHIHKGHLLIMPGHGMVDAVSHTRRVLSHNARPWRGAYSCTTRCAGHGVPHAVPHAYSCTTRWPGHSCASRILIQPARAGHAGPVAPAAPRRLRRPPPPRPGLGPPCLTPPGGPPRPRIETECIR